MWRRKQAKKPLVPGRDRSLPRETSARPVYSYYAAKSAPKRPPETAGRVTAAIRPASSVRSVASHAITWICFAVVLLCAFKVLAVVPSSKVVVTRNDAGLTLATNAYSQTADEATGGSVLNRNKITFDAKGVARAVSAKHPELTSVVVATPLIGNRPVVYVAATKMAFVLQTGDGMYSLGQSGYVIARVSQPTNGLLTLKDMSGQPVILGKQYLPGSTLVFISTIAYQLQKAGYAVDNLDLPLKAPYELDAYLVGKPYYIRFNLKADALEQSGGAVATLRQMGTTQPSQYLDMRVPGRAYYK